MIEMIHEATGSACRLEHKEGVHVTDIQNSNGLIKLFPLPRVKVYYLFHYFFSLEDSSVGLKYSKHVFVNLKKNNISIEL